MSKQPTIPHPTDPSYRFSSRYTHNDTIGKDFKRIGNGDITGWAKGVSRPFGTQHNPIRPKCNGPQLNVSRPVTRLSDMVKFHGTKREARVHDKSEVVMPHETTAKHDACDINAVMKIQKNFWKMLGVARGGDVRVKA